MSDKDEASRGDITVQEAGRRGGARGGRKGGETTRDRYGHEFYEEIGRKGGTRVRDLIKAGKKAGR
jgi:general stress protein YciG